MKSMSSARRPHSTLTRARSRRAHRAVALSLAFAAAGLGLPTAWQPARAASPASVAFSIDTRAGRTAISPLIYGINGTASDPAFAAMMAAARPSLVRLGGNRWTAYNWRSNNSNAGSDWCYQNDDYLAPGSTAVGAAVLPTVRAAQAAGAASIVTIPIGDFVSADRLGVSQSTNNATYGQVQAVCAGNVMLTPDYPTTRFVPNVPTAPGASAAAPNPLAAPVAQDQFIRWLRNAAPKARVVVSLDNEPDLWACTHAEVRAPLTVDTSGACSLSTYPVMVGDTRPMTGTAPTYDEIVSRDVAFARAVKSAWPTAAVIGPVNYGWDGIETLQGAPDAASKGNFADWYMRHVHQANAAAGRTLVDAYDLHWYSAAQDAAGIPVDQSGSSDTPATKAAREQAPRSLWDPTYVERSYIASSNAENVGAIKLIPRLQSQIAADNPGMGLSFSEWNFGGSDISNTIAAADTLGIFGRSGVYAATMWPEYGAGERASYAAFAAFRNYDGNGSTFGDTAAAATNSDPVNTSVYAATDAGHPGRLVIVAINKNTAPTSASVNLAGFAPAHASVYRISSGDLQPKAVAAPSLSGTSAFTYTMPAQSVSVIALSSS